MAARRVRVIEDEPRIRDIVTYAPFLQHRGRPIGAATPGHTGPGPAEGTPS